MNITEAARRVRESIAHDIHRMAPSGIGGWEPAWEIVASASAEFRGALCAWEQSPSEEHRAQVRYWSDEVMARWCEAIEKFEEAHYVE